MTKDEWRNPNSQLRTRRCFGLSFSNSSLHYILGDKVGRLPDKPEDFFVFFFSGSGTNCDCPIASTHSNSRAHDFCRPIFRDESNLQWRAILSVEELRLR